ncbi:hypothetical protein SAMN02910447_03299 [Ruminococcus sp. YE71]|nr:hypothetical protein SAMN02910446_03369 [Ruminococcus sp. YE78]SFW50715.1 hypothetical protein SAMN02910447_03299 [Ruminococcus sp. YE71]
MVTLLLILLVLFRLLFQYFLNFSKMFCCKSDSIAVSYWYFDNAFVIDIVIHYTSNKLFSL